MIGIIFIFWLIHANSLIVRIMADLTLTTLLNETPLAVIIGLMAVTVATVVIMGPEVIARYAELVFFFVVVMVLFIWGCAVKDLELHHLLPLAVRGISPIIRASLPVSAVFGEVIILGVLLPFLEEPQKVALVGTVAIAIALVRMLVGILFETSLFGVPETSRMLAPMLELSSSIQIAGLIERVDALLAGTWLINTFVKMALFLYAAVLGLAQLARLPDYRPLVFPVMATTAVIAYGLFSSTADL